METASEPLEICPICGCDVDYFVYAHPFSDQIVGCDECADDDGDDA